MDFEHTRSREELITAIAESGKNPKFVFFWGHKQQAPHIVDKSCFSQWYPAPFAIDDITYQTAEHFMMAEKARLFEDLEKLQEIIECDHPHQAKKLGRQVANFCDQKWRDARFDAVVKGNVAKFTQNPPLKEYLLTTGNRILVEASPRDRVWGIGMGAKNPNAETPANWRGSNLLGFALMETRAVI